MYFKIIFVGLLGLLVYLNFYDTENRRVMNNTYVLYEKINKDSVDEFIYHAKRFKIDTLRLESTGGEIYQAYKIVDIVQKQNIHVVVPRQKTCQSACTYIFIGTKNRDLQGLLGIHEPAIGKIPYRNTTGQYRSDLNDIRDYLYKLVDNNNVNRLFIDDMYSTPNEKIMLISPQTFKKYYEKAL